MELFRSCLATIKSEIAAWSESSRDWMIFVAWFTTFILFAIIILFDSSLAFGLSLGFWGALIRFAILLLAVLLAVLMWSLIFYVPALPRKVKSAGYAVAVLLTAMALDAVIIDEADDRWGFGEYLVTQKVEYFCFKRFYARECVRHVNVCPSCALKMEKWKRDKIAERLKNIQRHLASTPNN